MPPAPPIDIVCILHGGFTLPVWLVDLPGCWRLHLTLNDPADHEYADLPAGAVVTRNPVPLGFAQNVNAALGRTFADGRCPAACIVNFDLQARPEDLRQLVSTLEDDETLAAAGAVLCSVPGEPTFSVGTLPTPTKEALRAAGLRNGRLMDLQRSLLKHTSGWAARNQEPPSGTRFLAHGEYLPWTCLAVSSRAYSSVGGLDERFPLYAEDIDWSLRCQQSSWRLALVDCGPVIHAERATRSPRTDALFEFSHLELHRKWHWDANLAWQRRALRVRRRWPVRRITAPLDWSVLTNLDGSSGLAGPNGAVKVGPATMPYVAEPGKSTI